MLIPRFSVSFLAAQVSAPGSVPIRARELNGMCFKNTCAARVG